MSPTCAISSTCCLSSWDVTESLNRFSRWEKPLKVNDPVPEAISDNVLQWTPSTHLFFHSALPQWSWCQPVGLLIGCSPTTVHVRSIDAVWKMGAGPCVLLLQSSSHSLHAVRQQLETEKSHNPKNNVLNDVIYDQTTHYYYTLSSVRCVFNTPPFCSELLPW